MQVSLIEVSNLLIWKSFISSLILNLLTSYIFVMSWYRYMTHMTISFTPIASTTITHTINPSTNIVRDCRRSDWREIVRHVQYGYQVTDRILYNWLVICFLNWNSWKQACLVIVAVCMYIDDAYYKKKMFLSLI